MIEQRIARLRAFLQEHDADGVIIVQPENLRYFSAFTGGEGALVIGLDQASYGLIPAIRNKLPTSPGRGTISRTTTMPYRPPSVRH